MQAVDIHLAEMAGWRALLTKAQFVAKVEIHTMLEEYVVRMVFRVTRAPRRSGFSPHHAAASGGERDTLAQDRQAAEFPYAVGRDAADEIANLRVIGDQCLLCAGLFPEQAGGRNVPITHFVEVGRTAYHEYGQYAEEPIFGMLSAYFVDVMDILQTVRELEYAKACIDPLDAYQLWRDTGSVRAWAILRRFTSALPGGDRSAAVH
jgi:hypothetical protein